jgi:hypothetical protein
MRLDLGRLPHEELPQRLNRRESLRRSTACGATPHGVDDAV